MFCIRMAAGHNRHENLRVFEVGPKSAPQGLEAQRISKKLLTYWTSICRQTRFERVSSLEEAAESSPGLMPGVGSENNV
jgi:hypothetical protein